jgi:hypothetical protein
MLSVKKTTGVALAMAAAAMLAIAPMAAHAGSMKGKCMGANSCKGLSSCKTATSSCKGFLEMSQAECTTAGGDFQA